MKTAITFIFSLLILTGFSQNVWDQVSEKSFATSSDYFLVKNPDRTNTEKMTLTTLTSIADSVREQKDDSIYYYCGFTTAGRYLGDETTTHLQAADFTAASKTPTLNNALYILDSVIVNDLWEAGSGTTSIKVRNATDTAAGNYSLAVGRYTNAKGNYTFTHGAYSMAPLPTSRATSSGQVYEGRKGSSQYIEFVAYITTTSNTNDTLRITGVTDLSIPTDAVVNYTIECTAVQVGGSAGTIGDSYQITVGGGIKNIAGTTALLTGATDTISFSKDAAFDGGIVVSADDTNDALCIVGTGVTNKNFYYVATIRATMVGFRNFTLYE